MEVDSVAERRMFSKRVINTARFLKMPPSTQCLYFHLGLNADDDGVVEAYTIMNSIGATEDDLKILVSKEFVQVLNSDLVTYIVDWRENNKLRADRKVDSMYKDLLLQLNPNIKLLESKERTDRKNGTSNGQPMDSVGKDSIGEYSIEQDSIDKESINKSICTICNKKISNKEYEKYSEKCRNCYMEEKFNIFWSKYPKRVGKEKAKKAFFKICLEDVMFREILEVLEKFKKTDDWKKQKGKFIPYPSSWLNQKRWEDEFEIEITDITTENNIDSELEERFDMKASGIYE